MDNSDYISITDVVAIIRRQARLIALAVLCALGAAAVFLFVSTPLYTAQTLILVQPNHKNLLDPASSAAMSAQAENAFVESEVEILRSDSVALQAVRDGEIVADPEFGPSLGLADKIKQAIGLRPRDQASGAALLADTLTRFKSAVSVRRRGLTYLIAVSFTSETPERAAELANLVAQTYVRAQVSAKVAAIIAARDVLNAQLSATQERLTASDQAMSAYIDANIDRLQAQSGDPSIDHLRRLAEQRQDEITAIQSQLRVLSAAVDSHDFGGLEHDALRALQRQREGLQSRLDQGANSGDLADLRADLARLDQQIETVAQKELGGLQSKFVAARQQDRQAQQDLRQALLSTNLPADVLADLYGLQQNAAIAQSQYDNLLLRLRDLEVQASVQVADSRIVSPALPPRKKSFPNTKLILALAGVIGAMVGIALALLNEFFIGGVHSARQLTNLLPVKTAEALPRLARGAEFLSPADAIIDQPMSIYAEGLRRIKASIDRRLGKSDRATVIAVTSSLPAEGKSVLSLSLARTYASAGKSVLLIDADMRKPSQFKLLGVEPRSGLLEYLTSAAETKPEDFYDLDPKSSVGVVLGHTRSAVPTDVPLQSGAFENLIAEARNSFDIIVVDTPPVLPLVDTRYVVAHADCVVMAVRAGATGQPEIRACYEQITDAAHQNTPIFAVLNAVEQAGAQYYGSAYYGAD